MEDIEILNLITEFNPVNDYLIKYLPLRPDLSEINGLSDGDLYLVHIFNDRVIGLNISGARKAKDLKERIYAKLFRQTDFDLAHKSIEEFIVLALYILATKTFLVHYRKALLDESASLIPFLKIIKAILKKGYAKVALSIEDFDDNISIHNIFDNEFAALSFIKMRFSDLPFGPIKQAINEALNFDDIKIKDIEMVEKDLQILNENFSNFIETRGAFMLASFLQHQGNRLPTKSAKISSKSISLILEVYKILGFVPSKSSIDINSIKAFRERLRKRTTKKL